MHCKGAAPFACSGNSCFWLLRRASLDMCQSRRSASLAHALLLGQLQIRHRASDTAPVTKQHIIQQFALAWNNSPRAVGFQDSHVLGTGLDLLYCCVLEPLVRSMQHFKPVQTTAGTRLPLPPLPVRCQALLLLQLLPAAQRQAAAAALGGQLCCCKQRCWRLQRLGPHCQAAV